MTPQFFLGEDQLTVERQLEFASAGGEQIPGAHEGFNLSILQDFVRQTDGARGVVSNRAVFKLNIQQSVLHDLAILFEFVKLVVQSTA